MKIQWIPAGTGVERSPISQNTMPRRSRPASVVIRNMMIAERNDAEMMPPSKQRRAVELAFAAAQKINCRNRRDGPEKRAQRRDQRKSRRNDQRQNRAQRRAARNAQNERVGQRIAQQGLETRARN